MLEYFSKKIVRPFLTRKNSHTIQGLIAGPPICYSFITSLILFSQCHKNILYAEFHSSNPIIEELAKHPPLAGFPSPSGGAVPAAPPLDYLGASGAYFGNSRLRRR